jgi:hypothetical protein
MSLAGNLRTMELPDILQWISSGRKTGTLHLQRRSVEKRIVFQHGTVYTSYSNDPREYMGQFLVRTRRISEEQLFKALLRQEKTGQALGAILIGEGLLDEDEVRTSLKEKAEETIYELFLWPEGKFEFKEGDVPKDIPITLDADVTSLIMEGIRRVDEWGRIKSVFPTPNTSFVARASADKVPDVQERELLELAAAGKTMADMALATRRGDFDVACSLYEMYNRGLIAVDKVEEDPWGADPVGAIHDLIRVAEQRLHEKRFDAALEAYEQVLHFDRLNQNAKKGLIAVIEARDRERAVRSVPLDKIPALAVTYAELTKQNFDPQEGFVISRINGEWDVRSILKLCPMSEEDALLIFSRLLKRKVIDLR